MDISPWICRTVFGSSLPHVWAILPWDWHFNEIEIVQKPAASRFSVLRCCAWLRPKLSLEAVHGRECIDLSILLGWQTGEEATAELAELRERCSDQAKEREALHTILDAKIRALVKDVASSIHAIPNQVCLVTASPSLCSPEHCTLRSSSTSATNLVVVSQYFHISWCIDLQTCSWQA